MKETVQKTLTGEAANRQTVAMQPPVNLTDIIWLPIKYFISTANLQRVLFLLAFLTYGVGDGVTAAYMMERTGAMREINPVVRFIYVSSGAQSVITFKIWFVFIILFLVWVISRRTNTYWTINGFLSALCVGGIMAIRANLMAAYGATPPSANSIIMAFLTLTVLFVVIGDMMDKLSSTGARQVHGSQTSPSF